MLKLHIGYRKKARSARSLDLMATSAPNLEVMPVVDPQTHHSGAFRRERDLHRRSREGLHRRRRLGDARSGGLQIETRRGSFVMALPRAPPFILRSPPAPRLPQWSRLCHAPGRKEHRHDVCAIASSSVMKPRRVDHERGQSSIEFSPDFQCRDRAGARSHFKLTINKGLIRSPERSLS